MVTDIDRSTEFNSRLCGTLTAMSSGGARQVLTKW
jgi:hypothetical protein